MPCTLLKPLCSIMAICCPPSVLGAKSSTVGLPQCQCFPISLGAWAAQAGMPLKWPCHHVVTPNCCVIGHGVNNCMAGPTCCHVHVLPPSSFLSPCFPLVATVPLYHKPNGHHRFSYLFSWGSWWQFTFLCVCLVCKAHCLADDKLSQTCSDP